MKKYLLLGIILILSSMVFADWTVSSGTFGNGFNTWYNNDKWSDFSSDNGISLNFTNSMGDDVTYGNNLLSYQSYDIWEHNILYSLEVDGYLRAFDGQNASLIVEQYIGEPTSSQGIQILDTVSEDGMTDLFTLINANFTWYQFNKTSFVNKYSYGLENGHNFNLQEILCLGNGFWKCYFLDGNQTIYIFDILSPSITTYTDFQLNNKYDERISRSSARPTAMWDISTDNNYEFIFIDNNATSINSFDVSAGTVDYSFGGIGTVPITPQLINKTVGDSPQMMLINTNGGNSWEIVATTVSSNFLYYSMLNAQGSNITSNSVFILINSRPKLFLSDCAEANYPVPTIFFQAVSTSQCTLRCYPNYNSQAGMLENTISYWGTCPVSGAMVGEFNVMSNDLDHDGFYDDILYPKGIALGIAGTWGIATGFDVLANDTYNSLIIDDVNDDGTNDLIIKKQGTQGLRTISTNYTNIPPTITSISYCAGNPIQYGQTQRYTIGYSDTEGSYVRGGVICEYDESLTQSINWSAQTIGTLNVYCSHSSIGSFTTRIYLTDTISGLGYISEFVDYNARVDYVGSLSQDALGNWICQNGDTEGATNLTDGGTGGINETDFDCATNPLYCQGNYQSSSFDWTQCNGWTIMYPLCPLWYISANAMTSTFNWIFSSSFYIALMFIITGLIILIFYKIKNR